MVTDIKKQFKDLTGTKFDRFFVLLSGKPNLEKDKL
jgi:hypothetical protein